MQGVEASRYAHGTRFVSRLLSDEHAPSAGEMGLETRDPQLGRPSPGAARGLGEKRLLLRGHAEAALEQVRVEVVKLASDPSPATLQRALAA